MTPSHFCRPTACRRVHEAKPIRSNHGYLRLCRLGQCANYPADADYTYLTRHDHARHTRHTRNARHSDESDRARHANRARIAGYDAIDSGHGPWNDVADDSWHAS